MITRKNRPSMEVQLDMTVACANGDVIPLPLQIDQYDESDKATDTGKSEIGTGDVFATKFYCAGPYRFYCSENRDLYVIITVK